MVRKRLDNRVRLLLERGLTNGHRSLLVLVGDHGKDQVPHLHAIWTKAQLLQSEAASENGNATTNANATANNRNASLRDRPSVLWCYKKDLGFSTHQQKRLKRLKRNQARGLVTESDDALDLFCAQANITWCYYKDSHRVLGTSHNLLILQDFEALTPNCLARCLETVRGGGFVILLLRSVNSLQQLYTMTMDVHARYRTEKDGRGQLQPRFNERFLLSLARCPACLVCDDELNVLPLSRKTGAQLEPRIKRETKHVDTQYFELRQVQESLVDAPHVGALAAACQTLDQCRAVLVVLEACSDLRNTNSNGSSTGAGNSKKTSIHNNNNIVVSLTAARGRGKSAGLGLALAGAVGLGHSHLLVTAPGPENVATVFDFLLRGLQALEYQQHLDYTIHYDAASGSGSNSSAHSSSGRQTKHIVGVHLHSSSRNNSSSAGCQSIRYVPPHELTPAATAAADVIAIDEAAAIPLPIVQGILQRNSKNSTAAPCLFVLSSTINGYEGTGRALSLKLIADLRQRNNTNNSNRSIQAATNIVGATKNKGDFKVHEQRWAAAAEANSNNSNNNNNNNNGGLREIELTTPIRYQPGDAVEAWLNRLLCLDCNAEHITELNSGAPAPSDCELFHVNRDALFSFHKLSEQFLQRIWGLYTSAHYKNSPNDLQMLSDAPAHRLYCLLAPPSSEENDDDDKTLPDVLCVVQVALEGQISRKAVQAQLARGHRAAGDLIPWTLAQQFGEAQFATLSGARIVRIAVHPKLQGMGYGSRALELLYRYYNGELMPLGDYVGDDEDAQEEEEAETSDSDDDEDDEEETDSKVTGLRAERLKPRKVLPPLLLPLNEVRPPALDWLGTSFGLTLGLQKFWSRAGLRMLYLRQTKNDLTGEHSAILVRALPNSRNVDNQGWLESFTQDVRRRLVSLLGGSFAHLSVRLALAIVENVSQNSGKRSGNDKSPAAAFSADELDHFLTAHDLKRLELYGRNLCDHHLITDLLPTLARLYFLGKLGPDCVLSSVQAAVICGIGLQRKTVDHMQAELALPVPQVLAMFNKAVRKLSITLNGIVEEREKKALNGDTNKENKKRAEMEAAVSRMRDVTEKTLEEDVQDAANAAMQELQSANNGTGLPSEIAQDEELMQFAVKGTDEQWQNALSSKSSGGDGKKKQMVQIAQTREKRKTTADDMIQLEVQNEERRSGKRSKKSKKKSRRSV